MPITQQRYIQHPFCVYWVNIFSNSRSMKVFLSRSPSRAPMLRPLSTLMLLFDFYRSIKSMTNDFALRVARESIKLSCRWIIRMVCFFRSIKIGCFYDKFYYWPQICTKLIYSYIRSECIDFGVEMNFSSCYSHALLFRISLMMIISPVKSQHLCFFQYTLMRE